MALIADPLKHEERLGLARKPDRFALPGNEHLLELLRQRNHGNLLAQPQLIEDPHGRCELPLATVDHQQLRRVRELAVTLLDRLFTIGEVGRETAGEHLFHRGEVIVAVDRLDLEASVLRFLGETVLHHHHRADIVGALDVAHVVALDSERSVGKVEIVLQLIERTGATVVVAAALEPMPSEALLRVLGDRCMELALVASLRNPDRDLALS